jgi:hypothetical protein
MSQPQTFTREEVLEAIRKVELRTGYHILAHFVDVEPRLSHQYRPRSPSTFTQQVAAVKRSPSGTMPAVRIPDTDPCPKDED